MRKAEYQAYLASREWALKREMVRERSYGKCERCYKRDMDAVHHITYERVGNESPDDLMAICDPCHEFLSGKSHKDPRLEWNNEAVQIEHAHGTISVLYCPICGGRYLHQQSVHVFHRLGGADGESCAVVIDNDSGDVLPARVRCCTAATTNPSPHRQGILVTFDCEHCGVTYPARDKMTAAERRGDERPNCELPLALAIYQHKGNTFIEWVPIYSQGTDEAPKGTF